MNRHLPTLACWLLISSVAFAAEQTVKGKIKSVDVTKNSITLDDLELDVTRKTKITVEGNKATLADIKVGHQAKIVYDDGLDVAASIAVGADEAASKSESVAYKKSGCRVVWTIAENGDSTLLISRPLENREKATDSLISHEDGTVEFQHGLATVESAAKAMMNGENVEFNKRHKSLLMKPKPIKGLERPTARFYYSKIAMLPLTIEYEFDFVEPSGDFPVGLYITNRRINTEYPLLHIRSTDDLNRTVHLECFWHASRDEKGKARLDPLVEDTTVDLSEPKEFKFTIPLNADDVFMPQVNKLAASSAVLQFLSVRGRLRPTFGVGFDEKNLVKNVFLNGLGDTIGIKMGDVVVSINGNKTTSMADTMEYLAKIQFGEESEIVVKRNNKTVKIGFTAE